MALDAAQDGHRYLDKLSSGAKNSPPITQCPQDVLMSIFEASIILVTREEELAMATTISHVCKLWRYISVNMPRLWQDVVISCLHPLDHTLAFLDHMHSRVKNRPINLLINDIDNWNKVEVQSHNLHCLRLSRFPHVRFLKLHIWEDDSLHQLLLFPLSHPFKGCKIDDVEIYFENSNGFPQQWNLKDLVQHLPTVKALNVSWVSSLVITNHNLFNHIIYLSLRGVHLDSMTVLRYFINLEELALTSVTIMNERQTITLPSFLMKRLCVISLWRVIEPVDCALSHCLRQILCPALARLRISEPHITECREFISSHPSIVVLDLVPSYYVPELIISSPQLESLTIELYDDTFKAYEAIWELPTGTPPFPKLKILSIYEKEFQSFGLHSFEKLVRRRCLPRSHPHSKLLPSIEPIQQIFISLDKERPGDWQWMASGLYIEATKVVQEKKTRKEIRLSWVSCDITEIPVVQSRFIH